MQCGQGADEILAGYSWYQPLLEADGDGLDAYAARVLRPRRTTASLALLGDGGRLDEDVSAASPPSSSRARAPTAPVDRALRLDTEVMLVDDPVKRVDNMTMALGLEARTPFLDHDLVELAAACPPALKLADGGKGVLKDAARRVLPAEVIDRPKGYFPVPALSHLEGPYVELVARRAARARPRATARCSARRGSPACSPTPTSTSRPATATRLWQLGLLELWLQKQGV